MPASGTVGQAVDDDTVELAELDVGAVVVGPGPGLSLRSLALAVGFAVAVTAFEALADTLEGLSEGRSVTAASAGPRAEGVGAARIALKSII